MTFYEKYRMQCAKKGVSASAAAKAIGLSNAAATGWKNGKEPQDVTIQKLADYFGCTVDDLKSDKAKEPAGGELVNGDADLTEYLEELRTRPEMRMLFHTFAGATKEQVEAIVKAWEAMQQR